MRFTSLLRFVRFKSSDSRTAAQPTVEHLDAFLSENASAADLTGSSEKPHRSQLLPILAALAIIEAVPAGLWLHQTFAISEARAADVPVPSNAAPPLTMAAPCEVPAAPVEPTAPVAAKGTSRTAATATAGTTAASSPPPRSVGGLVSVAAPVPMRIYSRGRIVGTTEAESLMLPVGSHELEFVSEAAGFKARRTVTVQAGRTSTVRLEAPTGTVHINASPWAEVWIDGHRVGDTPIGNLQVPIGTREFVFRHPELGERRRSAFVTLKEPIRISMDLRTK